MHTAHTELLEKDACVAREAAVKASIAAERDPSDSNCLAWLVTKVLAQERLEAVRAALNGVATNC